MGWGSATELFDGSVDVTLSFISAYMWVTEEITAAVVERTYKDIDWNDWDTQDESKYFHLLVHVLHRRDELGPGYYEWYTSGEPDDFDWSLYS